MQQPAAGTFTPNVDENFIHKQFGEEFTLTPLSTAYVRDVDGDGVDDMVIVARSKKPMLDAAEHSYKVVDPSFHNWSGLAAALHVGRRRRRDANRLDALIAISNS